MTAKQHSNNQNLRAIKDRIEIINARIENWIQRDEITHSESKQELIALTKSLLDEAENLKRILGIDIKKQSQ